MISTKVTNPTPTRCTAKSHPLIGLKEKMPKEINLFVKVFGRNTICNPFDVIRNAVVESDAETNLRRRFTPGVYTDAQQINEILKHQFEFYAERVKRLMKKLASRDFMEFLLYQYDLTTEVQNLNLHDEQGAGWKELGPELRRGLKYLAEQTALRAPPESTVMSVQRLKTTVGEAIFCALQMVRAYHFSDVTYGLFPTHTRLEIFPANHPQPFSLSAIPPLTDVFSNFGERLARHVKNQQQFCPKLTIDIDPVAQTKVLDPYFHRGFGMSFKNFCGVLTHVIEDPLTLPTRYPIPFCHLGKLLAEITKSDVSPKTAQLVVAGFTLSRAVMAAEGREMWNVKQNHRAFRRPLFEFPHYTGKHLVWSRGMARESILALMSGATFQKLPSEWLIPEVRAGLSALSNQTGLWFENLAIENLSRLGLNGKHYKTNIPINGGFLEVPAEVGEIDFLAGAPAQQMMILAEFKMVEMATEPKFYRDDVSQFVTKKNSYTSRFQRKIKWI